MASYTFTGYERTYIGPLGVWLEPGETYETEDPLQRATANACAALERTDTAPEGEADEDAAVVAAAEAAGLACRTTVRPEEPVEEPEETPVQAAEVPEAQAEPPEAPEEF